MGGWRERERERVCRWVGGWRRERGCVGGWREREREREGVQWPTTRTN